METRLNHFILWCKNWYEPVHQEDVFVTLKKVLALDGYGFIQSKHDIFNIVFGFIDDMIQNGTFDKSSGPLRFQNLYQSVQWHKTFLQMDDDKALIYSFRNFFEFSLSKDEITLSPPVYSRKLFKKGLKAPDCIGKTYTHQNKYANNFFKK